MRDVAVHQILTLNIKETYGERYILNSGSYWLKDVCATFNEKFIKKGYILPTKTTSKLFLTIISWFDSNLKPILPYIGKPVQFSTKKFRNVMKGCAKWRSLKFTIYNMMDDFLDKKLVNEGKVS